MPPRYEPHFKEPPSYEGPPSPTRTQPEGEPLPMSPPLAAPGAWSDEEDDPAPAPVLSARQRGFLEKLGYKRLLSDSDEAPLNCELCGLRFDGQKAAVNHFLGLQRKHLLKKAALKEYLQFCLDDEGLYVVKHSLEDAEDLVVKAVDDNILWPSKKDMSKQWREMHGDLPHAWDDDKSVLMNFDRSRWEKIKRKVDRKR